jgi:hypothetical protein
MVEGKDLIPREWAAMTGAILEKTVILNKEFCSCLMIQFIGFCCHKPG